MAVTRIVKSDNGELKTDNKGWLEKAAPFMAVLIVVMAFALGSMWTKLNMNKSGSPQGGTEATVTGQPVKKYATFREAVKAYAKQIGADVNKLNSCMDSGEKTAVVDADSQQAGGVGVGGTPGFFVNGRFLGGAFPFEAFKELIDRELAGTGSNDPKKYTSQVLTQAAGYNPPAFIAVPKKIEVGNALTKGPDSAKVTVVEFSDFQCPFCLTGFSTVKQIVDAYGDKIRFVFKNLPLVQLHPHAQEAAVAFECARDQNKGWEMHDKLFETQNEWSGI